MHDDVGGAKGAVSVKDIVDHLVYATPDLSMGVQRIAEWLGVEPVPGGQHPGSGTRNALVALGPASYLEIVGPDPDQPRPGAPRWFRIDELQQPQLVTWATPVGDIHEVAHRGAAAGIHLGSIGDGRRIRADGVALTWRFSDPAVSVYDGVVPFLIDWGASPHPAMTAPPGGELIDLRAQHPNARAVKRCLDVLGLDVVIEHGESPLLVATIRTPRGDIELR